MILRALFYGRMKNVARSQGLPVPILKDSHNWILNYHLIPHLTYWGDSVGMKAHLNPLPI